MVSLRTIFGQASPGPVVVDVIVSVLVASGHQLPQLVDSEDGEEGRLSVVNHQRVFPRCEAVAMSFVDDEVNVSVGFKDSKRIIDTIPI